MLLLKKTFTYLLMLFASLFSVTLAVGANTDTAVIYGTPFYPSSYSPETMVYARNLETGNTYSLKVAEDAEQYKMTLPCSGIIKLDSV